MSIYRAGGGVVGATSKFTDHRLSPTPRGKIPVHQGGLPAHRGESVIKDPYHRLGGPAPEPPVRGLPRTPTNTRTPDQPINGHNKTPSTSKPVLGFPNCSNLATPHMGAIQHELVGTYPIKTKGGALSYLTPPLNVHPMVN